MYLKYIYLKNSICKTIVFYILQFSGAHETTEYVIPFICFAEIQNTFVLQIVCFK